MDSDKSDKADKPMGIVAKLVRLPAFNRKIGGSSPSGPIFLSLHRCSMTMENFELSVKSKEIIKETLGVDSLDEVIDMDYATDSDNVTDSDKCHSSSFGRATLPSSVGAEFDPPGWLIM